MTVGVAKTAPQPTKTAICHFINVVCEKEQLGLSELEGKANQQAKRVVKGVPRCSTNFPGREKRKGT